MTFDDGGEVDDKVIAVLATTSGDHITSFERLGAQGSRKPPTYWSTTKNPQETQPPAKVNAFLGGEMRRWDRNLLRRATTADRGQTRVNYDQRRSLPAQPPRSNRAGAKMRRLSNAFSMTEGLGLSLAWHAPGPGQNKRPRIGNGRAATPLRRLPPAPLQRHTAIPDSAAGRKCPHSPATPTAIAPFTISESRILLRSSARVRSVWSADGKIYGPWARGDPRSQEPPHPRAPCR